MSNFKCKCGASIPADSQFCPDCGKKVEVGNINNIDPNKWIDSDTFYQIKTKSHYTLVKCGIVLLIINICATIVCALKLTGGHQKLETMILTIIIALLLFFIHTQLSIIKKYNQAASKFAYFENNPQSSILITQNDFGKFGLSKFKRLNVTHLLNPEYDKIEFIRRNTYKLYKDDSQSIYSVISKEISHI